MSADHAEHSPVQPDNPQVLLIGAAVILVMGLFVTMVFGVFEFYSFTVHDQTVKEDLSRPNSALRELRAQETERLSWYQYVDQAKGVVRIPIDRAVALTLRDWAQRPGGVKSATATPAPAAPAAPAPAAPVKAPKVPAHPPAKAPAAKTPARP